MGTSDVLNSLNSLLQNFLLWTVNILCQFVMFHFQSECSPSLFKSCQKLELEFCFFMFSSKLKSFLSFFHWDGATVC